MRSIATRQMADRSDLGEVIFFGTYDERLHPRVQVLREGLENHGATVTVLNEPLGISTAQRVDMFSNPWQLVNFFVVLLNRWFRLWRASRRLHRRPDTVVVGYLGHFDIHLARRLFRDSTIVLDHLIGLSDTAKDRRLDGRKVVNRVLAAVDRRAVVAADIVVFDTDEHRQHFDPGGDKGVVIPVGAPTYYFDAAQARPGPGDDGTLQVLFFGLFTPLQGAIAIGQAISLLHDEPGVQFTVVGDGQDHPAARAAAESNDQVTWIRWVEPEEVPGLIASHDVCLGIFGTTPKALRVVPNKVYQGLAGGAAVITSDTLPQRQVLGDAALYVPPGDPDALAQALRDLHADLTRLKSLQEDVRELASRNFTPQAVTRQLAELLRGS